MATTTNYGWTTPDDTALVKDGAAAIRTLGSSVDTTTKALNPSTTLGDIEYRSSTANTNTRLGIGSTGNVLTVAGGVPTWATPAGGGGMTLLSTTTLSGASTTISSISQAYKELKLFIYGLTVSTDDEIYISTVGTTEGASYHNTGVSWINNGGWEIRLARSSAKLKSTGGQNAWYLEYPNYASTTSRKNYQMYGAYEATTGFIPCGDQGMMTSTTAISSITFTAATYSFNAGTVLLYGVN